MEAESLRIGNWVSVTSAEEWVGQVTSIIRTLDMSYLISITQVSTLPVEKFEPIPLTEEWLLKCDKYVKWQWFGSVNYGGYVDFTGRWKLMLRYWRGEFIFEVVSIDKRANFYKGIKKLRLKITYLHQLQNLYFALTGEELIINNK